VSNSMGLAAGAINRLGAPSPRESTPPPLGLLRCDQQVLLTPLCRCSCFSWGPVVPCGSFVLLERSAVTHDRFPPGESVHFMPVSRLVRVAIVGLGLALFAPLLTVPAASGVPHGLARVPMAEASWMILETSGIQCTFDVDVDSANGGCTANNVNVRVISSDARHSVGGELTVDLAVQNIGTLTLATSDGTTPDPVGVRLFVASGPFPTGGTGPVDIVNADGATSEGTLGKPYFQYAGALLGNNGILSPGETSGTKTWRLSVGPDVSEVGFSLGVAAEVPDFETTTPTSTPSPTLALTDTPTPLATSTNTPSPTSTDTSTSTPTAPPTLTFTPTSSSTPAQTTPPTSTPTQTLSPTATATSTSVANPTSTQEPTRTPKPTRPPKTRAG
jgi:hypothetical protein